MYLGSVITYGILLLFEAAEDFFRKKVHVLLLLLSAVPMGILCFADNGTDWKMRLLGAGVGVLFGLLGLLVKDSVGAGDAAAIGQMGIAFGFPCLTECLAISLGLLMVAAVLLTLFHKVNRKDTLPFFPFLFAGYLGMAAFRLGA